MIFHLASQSSAGTNKYRWGGSLNQQTSGDLAVIPGAVDRRTRPPARHCFWPE